MSMKAIIEKSVTVIPSNDGYITKDENKVITIRLFSIPIFRKEVTCQR